MENKQTYSQAKIQGIIMEDLLFRSPLWALLILVIYGIIMAGAMWFLLCVVKPSIDRKMQMKSRAEVFEKVPLKRSGACFEYLDYVGNSEKR